MVVYRHDICSRGRHADAVRAAGPALPDQVVISAVVLDKKGRPVLDLKPEEFVVTEGGSERQKLPQGTLFSIWSTSDSPKVIVPQGTDTSAVETPLRNVAPFGHNAALDTLVAASQELAKDETHRTAVVLVSTASMAGVAADMQALLPKASLKPTYIAIQFIQGPEDSRLQDALKALAGRNAGLHERVFSTMAIEAQLLKAVDVLSSSYRIAWKPAADPRQAKIEVKVKRPDARMTMAQRISTSW